MNKMSRKVVLGAKPKDRKDAGSVDSAQGVLPIAVSCKRLAAAW